MPMKFERGRVTKFMVEHEKNFKMSENLETSSLSEEEEQPRCEEKELLLYAENDVSIAYCIFFFLIMDYKT